MFRAKDGRFILVSAGNAPPNLQSHDLQSWQVVNKCGFGASSEFPTSCTDEGPHATQWNDKLWFNMDPRCDDTASTRSHCQNKSVLRSDDGGESFKPQPHNMFEDKAFSTRLNGCRTGASRSAAWAGLERAGDVLYGARLHSGERHALDQRYAVGSSRWLRSLRHLMGGSAQIAAARCSSHFYLQTT